MAARTNNEALYTVGEVANAFGITVRTLHHWEQAGLVEPVYRSWSNYRLYTPDDLERIQHILVYRTTGMKQSEIKEVLSHPTSNREHLRRQHERLLEERSRIDGMVVAVEKLLEQAMNNHKPTLEEIGKILGDPNYAEHQAEAQEAYGDTAGWAQYQGRTGNWGASDWEDSKQRFDAIDTKLADAVRRDVPTDSAEAAELVDEHRKVIGQFFDVTPEMQFQISRGYIADERFKRYYEERQPGLAQWLADAIAHATGHGDESKS